MADSNSNSYDIINNYSPKIEVDSESEREFLRRDQNAKCKLYWTTENTIKLIETMEKECRELWDPKNPLNRDRNTRQAKFEYLAEVIGTTSEEISRKVHNLRTQFNNELRKIKRGQVVRSGWEYFDALSFLMRTPSAEALETVDAVNLEVSVRSSSLCLPIRTCLLLRLHDSALSTLFASYRFVLSSCCFGFYFCFEYIIMNSVDINKYLHFNLLSILFVRLVHA